MSNGPRDERQERRLQACCGELTVGLFVLSALPELVHKMLHSTVCFFSARWRSLTGPFVLKSADKTLGSAAHRVNILQLEYKQWCCRSHRSRLIMCIRKRRSRMVDAN